MKYSILTFGCRTNQADSFDLERALRARGGEETGLESADLIVVNTCSVTATAEQAARQAIRRAVRLNPSARIVATGCYATRAPAELQAVAAVATPADRSCFDEPRTVPQRDAAQMPGPGTAGRTVHLLRVQTGCDERCAYCIVPATRGPSRSVPIDWVLEQADEAAASGFKEVMITGVHLGCYGRDLQPATRLAQLLTALATHPGGLRWRVSAVEPMDFNEDVVGAVAGSRRFAPHFHLPLQHASDRILRSMNRPYTLERYHAVVRNLLGACPDAAIGADLIVGFPGETDADHQACVDYLTSSPLAYLHVFPFSARPGTAAARMPGRPRGEDVRHRMNRLRAIGAGLRERYRARFVGAVREGLTIEDGTLVLTDNYLRVRIPRGFPRNERVRVKIVADGEPMTGVV